MKTKKIIIVAMCLLVATTLVRAAVLEHFGTVETNMEVDQSVVISDDEGETWKSWGESIERSIPDVVHCKDYVYNLWIQNRGRTAAEASFDDVCTAAPNGDSEGVDIIHYIFGDTQTISLRHKDPLTWEVLEDEELGGADITFNTCGTTFDYSMDYWNIPEGEYSLVYYIDQDPRFELWGKVDVIETISIEGTGTYSNSVDILTMPCIDDWNAGPEADYSVEPDNYEHANGAKLWLVPSIDIENGQMTVWNPDNYLFETDLALYINCDSEPICLSYVYPLFDTNILQPESIYCWISCYHVDFDIMEGTYAFNTYLDASEI